MTQKVVSRFVTVPSLEKMIDVGIVEPERYVEMLWLMYQYSLLNMDQAIELGVPEDRWRFDRI